MKNRILTFSSLAIAFMVMLGMACNKKFDQPGLDTNPGVTANTTIKQLKTLYTLNSGEMRLITDDIIIKGTVVGNDRTGNIYKMIYIQDATGGIEVDIDATGLYNTMPVGREVFILCKDLHIANVSSMIKLGTRVVQNGTPSLEGIRGIYVDSYIKRGSLNNPVTPLVVTVGTLNNDHQGMLIQLNNFEVLESDLNKTYADTSANKATTNITIKNCNVPTSDKIIVRTSGYANFAGVPLPKGKGNVTAIYTVFGTTKQLIVRDTADMPLNGVRCDGTSGTPVYKTLAEIRAMYTGVDVSLGNYVIRGVVISDAVNGKNIGPGNMIIQDGDRGIDLFFGTAANTAQFSVGDSIQIAVVGGTLTKFNGLLEITLPASALPASKLATGKVITPKVLTIAQLVAGIDNYEGTLVKVNSVTTPSGVYGGSNIINDGTGSMTLWTVSGATFASTALTAGCKNIVGIPTRFNTTNQLQIRDVTDVTAGTGCPASLPTLTTTAVSAITATTATSGGNITSDGGSAVTARGVVWSTATNPTVALSTKTSDGTGTGSFVSSITGLTNGTQYYVRAYATTSAGTAYGNEVSFTAGGGSGSSVVTEDFESGAKTSYTAATVTLSSGSWTFSDALIGTTAGSDVFNGLQSARIRER
jgi:hypothetical protein